MKKVEKSIIVVVVLMVLGVLISSIYLSNKFGVKEEQEIYGIINNKAYSLDEIEKEYGKDFIKEIAADKVVVFNGETTYDCEYDKSCDVWPNSKNGEIMWAEPLVTITFKQGDIKLFKPEEIISPDNEIDEPENENIDPKAKELMELYIAPVTQIFEGDYNDEVKTLLLINISEDIAKIADCKKLYGDKAKYEGDFEGQAGGYIVKEESDVYIDAGSFCEQDSKYYDAKLLREKSLELYGEDILVKQEIQDGWGSSFDYVEKEDGYVYLSCRGGTGPTGNQYEIVSSSIKDNQFLIDFDYYVINEKKTYTITFDIKENDKYVFSDLIEQ